MEKEGKSGHTSWNDVYEILEYVKLRNISCKAPVHLSDFNRTLNYVDIFH